jgi:hypothetical protein
MVVKTYKSKGKFGFSLLRAVPALCDRDIQIFIYFPLLGGSEKNNKMKFSSCSGAENWERML